MYSRFCCCLRFPGYLMMYCVMTLWYFVFLSNFTSQEIIGMRSAYQTIISQYVMECCATKMKVEYTVHVDQRVLCYSRQTTHYQTSVPNSLNMSISNNYCLLLVNYPTYIYQPFK